MIQSNVYLMDCIEGMKQYADNHFDLAVVDPPYGIGEDGLKNHSRGGGNAKSRKYTPKVWDSKIPTAEYFEQLLRVSKNQIVWGGNYMVEYLKPSMGWIFWDKDTWAQDFSDGEFAYTSFKRGAKRFKYTWCGFRQGPTNQSIEKRFHPTQKPVALYDWLLHNYAKQGDKILDTHLGSGSSRIAADKAGLDFTGFEIDKEYFDASVKRYEQYKAQLTLQF